MELQECWGEGKMRSSESFLRQLSSKEAWKSASRRWGWSNGGGTSADQMGFLVMKKKRVMVVVDHSSHSKQAMMWALTHVTNRGDILTLLQITSQDSSPCADLASHLAATCRASKPEVEVEAVVVEGPKMDTVMSQVKKLEVSVLVLGQKKKKACPLLLYRLCLSSSGSSRSGDGFVDKCINSLDCLTIGVRKQSSGVGGYLISTRWHKNFWLLA
ncbi:hypothetical protein M569_00770 [Genlisea aurea]|uniref:UspA domain-containing protein n=1 Tax=Genlisea aurea TaxID=192259 RepID=S8D3N0_9LAMI|nr:hypothetical protein M569_00770 [Genlisea aurea]